MIKIKRKCKPGEVNVHGISYDLISYKKAMEAFNEKIKYGISAELFSCKGYRYSDILKRQGFYYINPENCCGKIIEVTDEYITIEPNTFNEKFLNNLVNDGVELEACMRYVGDIVSNHDPVIIRTIITFDIMVPESELNFDTLERMNAFYKTAFYEGINEVERINGVIITKGEF